MRKSQEQIEALIAREIERGVSANKIVIAGFSQGCAMSLQVGLRHPHSLAGIMCLSGCLPLADKIANERHAANQNADFHGAWYGRSRRPTTARRAIPRSVETACYQIEWHDYWMQHSVSPQEISDIARWLRKVLN